MRAHDTWSATTRSRWTAVTGLFLVCTICPAFAQDVPIPEPKPEAATPGAPEAPDGTAPAEDDADNAVGETRAADPQTDRSQTTEEQAEPVPSGAQEASGPEAPPSGPSPVFARSSLQAGRYSLRVHLGAGAGGRSRQGDPVWRSSTKGSSPHTTSSLR